MSHNKRDQKRQFFHPCAAFICFETRTITFQIFSLSLEIAITTPNVGKKLFLCHEPSTETPISVVFSVPCSLAATSGILFFYSSLGATTGIE